ncbi:MAG: S49 family peptidase [Alphaproteobacteria bacterium]|nr:S49 family peptidase [Alphaproteobacteria bacterium]
MKRIMIGCLAMVGALTVTVVGIGITIGWWLWSSHADSKTRLGDRIVLQIDGTLFGADRSSPLSGVFGRGRPALRDVVLTLDRASRDPRVLGVVVDLSSAGVSMTAVQELAPVVRSLRAAGKLTVAHADTFGEPEGRMAYLLASGFERVMMQPSGDLPEIGVALERPYLARALERVGIRAEMGERYEHKGGIDMLVATGLSDALRDSLTTLVDDLHSQIVSGIATGRGLPRAAVQQLFQNAPLSAEAARAAGLIDSIGYWDQAEALAQRHPGGPVDLVDLADYAVSLPKPSGPQIALISARGPVVRSSGETGDLFGTGPQMAADRIAAAFDQAIADPEIKAILFRIDSPGGSYVASDTIARSVRRAREAGKPVVVSMGGIAASGGYFAAFEANHILAHPATLTGSIGVYGGKIHVAQLLERLDITVERVSAGHVSGLDDPLRPLSEDDRRRLEASLDRIYVDFSTRVGRARRLEGAALDAAARGRVVSGQRARQLGLVDEEGGYLAALAAARRLAGLPEGSPVTLVSLPRDDDELQQVLRLLEEFGGIQLSLAQLRASLSALAQLVNQIGLPPLSRDMSLTAPGVPPDLGGIGR